MMTVKENPVHVLMLEPDTDDRFITSSVIQELSCPVNLAFVNYPDELFHYLMRCRETGNAFPALILLGLTANVNDGLDTLKQLKSDPAFNHIPVIVLTGIRQQGIIKTCYALGASSFIQKPMTAADTTAKISNFFRYWLETAELA